MHIAFDLGNVIFNYDLDNFIKQIRSHDDARKIFPNYNEAKIFVQESEHLSYIGATTLYKRLSHKFSHLSEDNKISIINTWNNIIYPDQRMLDFIEELKKENVKIALLSNMGLEHAEYLRNKYPEVFDVEAIHLSYEVGAFKPTKLFYQSFLLEYPDFSECVYLDDLEENILMGSRFKFNSVLFDLKKLSQESEKNFKLNLDKIKNQVLQGALTL